MLTPLDRELLNLSAAWLVTTVVVLLVSEVLSSHLECQKAGGLGLRNRLNRRLKSVMKMILSTWNCYLSKVIVVNGHCYGDLVLSYHIIAMTMVI